MTGEVKPPSEGAHRLPHVSLPFWLLHHLSLHGDDDDGDDDDVVMMW